MAQHDMASQDQRNLEDVVQSIVAYLPNPGSFQNAIDQARKVGPDQVLVTDETGDYYLLRVERLSDDEASRLIGQAGRAQVDAEIAAEDALTPDEIRDSEDARIA
jgi:hypothetical protein